MRRVTVGPHTGVDEHTWRVVACDVACQIIELHKSRVVATRPKATNSQFSDREVFTHV